MNPLVKHLSTYIEFTEEESQYVQENLPTEMYQKGDTLLSQGDVSKVFYFLVKGCIRLYYLVNGDEKTAFFYTENEFVSSYESFTKQTPSSHYLDCLEDVELIAIPHTKAYELLTSFPKFEALARIMMEQELIVYQKIIANFIALNSEQRYIQLLEERPDLIQRIPQYQLATFLGVTPETLSRIRKKIVTE